MVSASQRAVVEAGKKIYERHRAELEARSLGQFAVIDTATQVVYVASSPDEAVRKAEAGGNKGPFHLVRIGSRAAYRSRRAPHGRDPRFAR
jgi:hypothetical protein